MEERYQKESIQEFNLKNLFIALKLYDPMTTAKIYWLILKTFYNGKKVSIIPPLLLELELASVLESDL